VRDLAELSSLIGTLHEPPKPVETASRPESRIEEASPAETSTRETPAASLGPTSTLQGGSEAVEPARSDEPMTPGEPLTSDKEVEPVPCGPVESKHFEGVSEPRTTDEVSAPETRAGSEKVRAAALLTIDRLLTLSVRDGGELPALEDCHGKARSLRESIEQSPDEALPAEAHNVASGEHPFANLLVMVEGNESLTDAQWALLHASVSGAYGRQLAIAAARGKLVFRS
jgi:hypothetical protein